MPDILYATFMRERDTKNTVRFQEVPEAGAAPIIGTLYVQKAALQGSGLIDVTSIEVAIQSVDSDE